MSEAERLARSLASVHDGLADALAGPAEDLTNAVHAVAEEIQNTPGLRLRAALKVRGLHTGGLLPEGAPLIRPDNSYVISREQVRETYGPGWPD